MILFVLVILSLLSVKSVDAVKYFYDDFSSADLSKWNTETVSEESYWKVENKKLKWFTKPNTSSKMYAEWNKDCSVKDYKVEAVVNNLSGIDQTFYIRVSNNNLDYYQIGFRYKEPRYPIDSNNITLNKFVNGRQVDGDRIAIYPGLISRTFDLTQNIEHKIKIVLSGQTISVFFDNNIAFSYADRSFNSIKCGGFGLLNWGSGSPVDTVNITDNIVISSLDDDGSIPITSTKLIFIPGMGASWNTDAIVYNKQVDKNSWRMTPFVNNYDTFFKALDSSGMVRNKDYFVWNYDWRKPLGNIVSDLNTFINENVGSGESFQIVGHSLGGVAGRLWYQDHKEDTRIKKVVSVGSPQSGAIDAYTLWNGGEMLGKPTVSGIALNILLSLHKDKYPTKSEVVKNFTPIFKDILPTFDFINLEGRLISSGQLNTKNEFLKSKNTEVGPILENYVSVVGTGKSTIEWISLDRLTPLDKMLGIWKDGHIRKFSMGNGDDTVLKKSAMVNDDQFVELDSSHAELVGAGGNKILGELNISGNVASFVDDLKDKNIIFIGSPAKVVLSCKNSPDAESDDQGFIVTKEDLENCSLKVVGLRDGTYHLVVGSAADNDSFKYFENEIKANEVDEYAFNSKSNGMWKELILRDTSLLLQKHKNNKHLLKLREKAQKDKVFEVLDQVLKFRDDSNEVLTSDRIIDNVLNILSENTTKIKKDELRKLHFYEHGRIYKYYQKLSFVEAYNINKAKHLIEMALDNIESGELRLALAKIYVAKVLVK